MKIGVGLGLVLWALHYAMLSGWSASATCLLIASRQILAFIGRVMSAKARRTHY